MYFLRKTWIYSPYIKNMIIKSYWKKNKSTPFYKILPQKLDIVKCYLDLHLIKRFIQANSAFYSSSVFFLKKSDKKI